MEGGNVNKVIKRILCFVCCGGFALSLPGCASSKAYGRELEDTVLVQVLGVDVMDGAVTLTAAGSGGEEDTVLETISAPTLAEAFQALPTAGDKYFSLTSVAHILVGDGVFLPQLLNYVLDDPDMSWTAKVWAVNGFAGKLMEQTQDGGIGRLSVLEQSETGKITVKTALAGLLSDAGASLPMLAAKDGVLEPAGTFYFEVSG